jgi:hypothetical protein
MRTVIRHNEDRLVYKVVLQTVQSRFGVHLRQLECSYRALVHLAFGVTLRGSSIVSALLLGVLNHVGTTLERTSSLRECISSYPLCRRPRPASNLP